MGRTRSIDGVKVPFTSEEEAAADVKESAFAAEQADYLANRKYKDDRAAAYPSIRDFADAYYWTQKGDDSKMTAYVVACAKVKSDNPKPE